MTEETQASKDAPRLATAGRAARPMGRPGEFQTRHCVRYRDAWMEHLLVPGGKLRRFVVLNSEALRTALGQPRRREIEPLEARQEHFEWRTQELWRWAEHSAQKSLRLMYSRLREAQDQDTVATPTPRTLARPPGQLLAPQALQGSARGILLFAGKRDTTLFCIELLDDTGAVRRVEGIDLARALEVSEAQVGEAIRVSRTARHDVTITEQRSGSHGEGRSTVKSGRETFQITRESALGGDSATPQPNRSARSA